MALPAPRWFVRERVISIPEQSLGLGKTGRRSNVPTTMDGVREYGIRDRMVSLPEM